MSGKWNKKPRVSEQVKKMALPVFQSLTDREVQVKEVSFEIRVILKFNFFFLCAPKFNIIYISV